MAAPKMFTCWGSLWSSGFFHSSALSAPLRLCVFHPIAESMVMPTWVSTARRKSPRHSSTRSRRRVCASRMATCRRRIVRPRARRCSRGGHRTGSPAWPAAEPALVASVRARLRLRPGHRAAVGPPSFLSRPALAATTSPFSPAPNPAGKLWNIHTSLLHAYLRHFRQICCLALITRIKQPPCTSNPGIFQHFCRI
jgi:hypothetical protein